MTKGSETTQLNITISAHLKKQLAHYCVEHEISLREWLETQIKEHAKVAYIVKAAPARRAR